MDDQAASPGSQADELPSWLNMSMAKKLNFPLETWVRQNTTFCSLKHLFIAGKMRESTEELRRKVSLFIYFGFPECSWTWAALLTLGETDLRTSEDVLDGPRGQSHCLSQHLRDRLRRDKKEHGWAPGAYTLSSKGHWVIATPLWSQGLCLKPFEEGRRRF